jgi:hypothetical protein
VVVSLTAYNRVDYLRETVDRLYAAVDAIDEPVFIVARVEPSDVQDVITSIIGGGRGTYVTVNDEKLGLQANTLAVLDDAWRVADLFREDFVLHLEDDLLISEDALQLAAWMRETYRGHKTADFVGLTNVHNEPTPEDYGEVVLTDWFECHVWGTWDYVWKNKLRPRWPHEWYDHWAARVNEGDIMRNQVIPSLSRSYSIGVYGEHCNPDFHARHNPRIWAGQLDPIQPIYRER